MRNKSVIPMANVDTVCGVDLLFFMDADGKTGTLRDAQFKTGTLSIARDPPTNYMCDASKFVRIKTDGSVMIGILDGQFMKTQPSAFRPPLTVVKMCLYISGTYRFAGIPLSFTSAVFQWPAAPGQRQWIEGPVVPELSNEEWIPRGSFIGAVWALRAMMTPDKKQFLPGALQCTHVT